MPTFLEIAKPLIEMGVPITPVIPGTKRAFLPDFPATASTNLTQIMDWARSYPNHSAACVARAEEGGVFFWEVDSADVWGRLLRETGHTSDELVTFRVRSRPGRGHLYFRHNAASIALGNISQTFVVGQDWSVRANREYVVAPGSLHPNTGLPYKALNDTPIAEAPQWLLDWLVSQKIQKHDSNGAEGIRNGNGLIPHGAIHGYLLTQAGKLRAMGLGAEEIEPVLMKLAYANCEPPLEDARILRMARSICNFPAGQPGRSLTLNVGRAATPVIAATPPVAPIIEDEDEIPPFDLSVVNGIYKKFVDVATRGTTMAPQFVYAIAKTVVGACMAGKVKFENLDVEPRFYAALIGETGSGKGEAWRRVHHILNVEGQVGNVSGLKIINSADSGAGIRDAFFEVPEEAPMLMFIDEVESFGNKAAATRNPAIMDMLIELADTTQISRVKAASKNSKANKTKNDARLCVVMCGQNGHVYMKAFAGRTQLGLWDRLTPEYSVAMEAGDLPPIPTAAAYEVLIALKQLDYSGTMTMSPGARDYVEHFWVSQPEGVRRKARWRKHFVLDAYMSAFGRGVKVVEESDVDIAIKIFTRQLAIRRVHFVSEVPDRTGYYLGLFKGIVARMERQLSAGMPPDQVALSRRDFERATHAHRDNEAHLFERAWNVYHLTWLTPIDVEKSNGRMYRKYLPVDEGE